VTSYAGFSGESTLLEELYHRGMAQPEIAPSLRAGAGLLMAWHHEPIAPWQDERWLSEMRRSLPPVQFRRMVLNEWVSSAEQAFVSMEMWDRIVTAAGPVAADRALPVFIGVDASTKLDSTAIAAVTFDRKTKQCRLVAHRVFVPTADEPVSFEAVEQALLDLHRRFAVRVISYDPWQFVHSSQRLRLQGLPMHEVAQTPANLTSASAALYELIVSGHLVTYPDRDMRAAIASATTTEGPRGARLTKVTRNARIDLAVALALAVHAAMEDQAKPRGFLQISGWESDVAEEKPPGQSRADPQAVRSWCEAIRAYSGGMWW
jgi:phage terminase large subunit-like protein